MSGQIQTSVIVQLSPSDGGDGPPLSIEPDFNAYADLNVHLLLFPAVDAQLIVDVGTIRYGITKSVNVPGGIVLVNGGTSASLPKPPGGQSPTIQVLRATSVTGSPIPVGVSFDAATGEVRLSAECYAAILYSPYKASARELIYTPLIESSRTTFGTIVAFYPPRSQIVYQVQPFGIDEGNVDIELYRIVSNSVANQDGEFEYPPGYPNNGSYPGSGFVFDVSEPSFQTQRVHEIGYMDLRRGLAYVTPFNVPTLEPFVGVAGYVPTKRLIESPLAPDKFDKNQISKAKSFIASRGYGKA